jgi:SAM-dependent methyltransferase
VSSIHETAKQGFVDGDVYERGRPSYPPAVLDALGISSGTAVCDLGCGTGKFTRLVASATTKVIGIEPLPAMLSVFRERTPNVHVVAGVAEALPMPDDSVDVVVCASAFHWFDHDRALPEIHRVLRPEGRLGIVWNRRDKLTGWPAELWELTEAYRRDTPGYRTGAWRRALEGSLFFGPIEEHWYDNVQRTDIGGVLARVSSASFVEIAPERDQILADVRTFLETHPETRGRDVIELPYHTAVYVSETARAR